GDLHDVAGAEAVQQHRGRRRRRGSHHGAGNGLDRQLEVGPHVSGGDVGVRYVEGRRGEQAARAAEAARADAGIHLAVRLVGGVARAHFLRGAAFLHQVAIRQVGRAAGAVLVGRAVVPEAGSRGPEALRVGRDETGRGVLGAVTVGVDEEGIARGVLADLVHLQVAEPARALRGVRAELADVYLVQVRAAHVH